MTRSVSPSARSALRGLSGINTALAVLVGLVVLLSVITLAQALMAEQRADEAFAGWNRNVPGYEKALAEQQKTGEPLLIYFYADWCPYCRNLNATLLSDETVMDFIHSRYIPVRIAPDDGKAENELAKRYAVTGYPTLYMQKLGGQPQRVIPQQVVNGRLRLKEPSDFITTMKRVEEEPAEVAKPDTALPENKEAS